VTRYRYYREWIPTPEFEVPEGVATGLAAFARGVFTGDGELLAVEMYASGKLTRVEYRGAVEDLPGVPYDVRVPGRVLGDLHWSVLRNHDAQGGRTGVTVQLLDRTERSLLEATYDAEGGREGSSKFVYDPAGELRYLLDYDEEGRLVDIYDRAEAKNPAFDPVLAELPDRQFYTVGHTLPARVSPGPDDDPDEIARRTLDRDDKGLPR
jgi:hypothetical protein